MVNLCKVFESIMRDSIIRHIEKHNLVKKKLSARVCQKQNMFNKFLLVFIEEVTNYLDLGYPVDVIYLDFQKHLTKSSHHRLLLKLEAHGIGGSVLRWIESWLCGRKHRVMLGGQVSDWSEVLSGVPQGSLLGPILFVLPYILVILMSNSEVLIWQVIT